MELPNGIYKNYICIIFYRVKPVRCRAGK